MAHFVPTLRIWNVVVVSLNIFKMAMEVNAKLAHLLTIALSEKVP